MNKNNHIYIYIYIYIINKIIINKKIKNKITFIVKLSYLFYYIKYEM